MTKSPVSTCWANWGLCLPRRRRAAWLARRPSTMSLASMTCQRRSTSPGFGVYVDTVQLSFGLHAERAPTVTSVHRQTWDGVYPGAWPGRTTGQLLRRRTPTRHSTGRHPRGPNPAVPPTAAGRTAFNGGNADRQEPRGTAETETESEAHALRCLPGHHCLR